MSEELLGLISQIIVIVATIVSMIASGLWIALVIWAFRDMRRRSRDPFAQILAALLVAAIPFVGIVLYLIVRPPETLAERYERALEEEALLQEIEERPRCQKCKRTVDNDWVMCPSCHSQLKKQCARCFTLLEMKWRRCPRCVEIQPDMPQELTPELLLKTIFPPAPVITVNSSTQLPAPQQQLPPPDQTRPVFRRRPVALPQQRSVPKVRDDNPTVSMEPVSDEFNDFGADFGVDEDDNPTIVTGVVDTNAINKANAINPNGKSDKPAENVDVGKDSDENPTVIQRTIVKPPVRTSKAKKKTPKTAVVKKAKSKKKSTSNEVDNTDSK